MLSTFSSRSFSILFILEVSSVNFNTLAIFWPDSYLYWLLFSVLFRFCLLVNLIVFRMGPMLFSSKLLEIWVVVWLLSSLNALQLCWQSFGSTRNSSSQSSPLYSALWGNLNLADLLSAFRETVQCTLWRPEHTCKVCLSNLALPLPVFRIFLCYQWRTIANSWWVGEEWLQIYSVICFSF